MYNFGEPMTGAAGFETGYTGYGAGHGTDCVAPGYGYGAPVAGYGAPTAGFGTGRGFALIVVLFILLVIIGASWATPGTV
ncbi:YjcZ family sporulation protein [Alkalihalobacillus deserti]|uniref:YjcZ family sporulation protein n=1 Tax=Alkalihalobacillus deserti TaxID=2879466 RepID=UPI0027E1593E|nr:YjcZ family sporulation protein [Alkalihalobacillus deserti]